MSPTLVFDEFNVDLSSAGSFRWCWYSHCRLQIVFFHSLFFFFSGRNTEFARFVIILIRLSTLSLGSLTPSSGANLFHNGIIGFVALPRLVGIAVLYFFDRFILLMFLWFRFLFPAHDDDDDADALLLPIPGMDKYCTCCLDGGAKSREMILL